MLNTTSSFLRSVFTEAEQDGETLVFDLLRIFDLEQFVKDFQVAFESVPSREDLFFRLEEDGVIVAVFTPTPGKPTFRFLKTSDPTSILGFNPLASLEEQATALADPVPSNVLSPRHTPGRMKTTYGGYRFVVGSNDRKLRNQALDTSRVLKARRAGRRGLAKRISAARKWHQSAEGDKWHQAQARYQQQHPQEHVEKISSMKSFLEKMAPRRFFKGSGLCVPSESLRSCRVENQPLKLRSFPSGKDLALGEMHLFLFDVKNKPLFVSAKKLIRRVADRDGFIQETKVHSFFKQMARRVRFTSLEEAMLGAIYRDRGSHAAVVASCNSLISDAQAAILKKKLGEDISFFEDYYDPKRLLRECVLSVATSGKQIKQIGPRCWLVDSKRVVFYSPRLQEIRILDAQQTTIWTVAWGDDEEQNFTSEHEAKAFAKRLRDEEDEYPRIHKSRVTVLPADFWDYLEKK